MPYLISYEKNRKDNKLVNNYINKTSYSHTEESLISLNDNYLFVLEIPKISLKKGIYDIDSKYNSLNYNIEILDESILNEEESTIFLAAHSGSSDISYFKNLDKLELNDFIYIYFNGTKYIYQILNIREINKGDNLNITSDKENSLYLITCKDKTDKQIVVSSKVINKEYY